MHVLLVDDHSLIRSGIKDSLSKHYEEITFSEAESTKTAHALLQEERFDVAIIDLFIPGEKLFTLVKECGDHNLGLSVIVLSSSDNPGHIRRCIDLGVVGYLSKSSPQSSFFDAIDIVLAGGTYFPAPPANAGAQEENASDADPQGLDYSDVKGLLTPRQMEILALIAQGQSNKQIANNLGLSRYTVKVHVSAVFKGLGLTNRSQAAVLGEKLGLTLQESGY